MLRGEATGAQIKCNGGLFVARWTLESLSEGGAELSIPDL